MTTHVEASESDRPLLESPGPSRLFRDCIQRIADPRVLFPSLGVLLLALLWSATANFVRLEREGADYAARVSTLEIAQTYEAQMVRALREIEQTLELVAYTYDARDPERALAALDARGLLPPGFLFVVSIVDADGRLVAATRARRSLDIAGVRADVGRADPQSLSVGLPVLDPASGQWWLDFARELHTPGGDFAGIGIVSVDAEYFVAGYEATQLGDHGLLGLIGRDGVFRVRRSGDDVAFDGRAGAELRIADSDLAGPEVEILRNPWDGVSRYSSARQIYGFPLALVVGLASAEQLALAEQNIRTYRERTLAASALLLVVLGVLGWMSWQLQRSRARVLEEQVTHAREVEYLAFHDSLTGLPNRSFFSKLLGQGIRESRRAGRSLALMFLDLDRFKIINDTLGHDAGDQLLCEVASRIDSVLRDSDVVARLGGDEFVILLPDTGDDAQLQEVARKVLSSVRNVYHIAGQDFRITVSIGGSVYPRDGEDEETLMKNADIAMYHAKEEGKNNFQFYSESLADSSLQRLALESNLRHAIDKDELRLNYQAKRDLRTGRISGMEALLRWEHPELGTIAPMQFIPLAEETGLILPIGRWVLETACRQSVAWRRDGMRPLSIAINLSPVQFADDGLLDDIRQALDTTGMDPKLLEIEITESSLMQDLDKAVRVMTELKALGIRIAIDDFGTGYSSLSALKQFPLDTIKIDGSFIGDLDANPESRGLTDAIIAMGRTLSLTVVAEGVESQAQLDYLQQHACDQYQGFFLNVPMPPDEFARMLATQT